MNEAENFNFNVGIFNEDRKNIPATKKSIGLDDIILFIKNKKLPQESEQKLIKIVNNMPYGSFDNFKKNFRNYLR